MEYDIPLHSCMGEESYHHPSDAKNLVHFHKREIRFDTSSVKQDKICKPNNKKKKRIYQLKNIIEVISDPNNWCIERMQNVHKFIHRRKDENCHTHCSILSRLKGAVK